MATFASSLCLRFSLLWTALAAFALGVAACGNDATTRTVVFANPTGLALAGSNHDRLFIANSAEDTVQVGVLGTELSDFAFIRGEAVSFPLRIPAGPNPRDLAATPDGRFVVVLNQVGETVRLLDADNLVPVRFASTGEVVSLPVGEPGSGPAALVSSPLACAAPCLGRFFVTLSGQGSVLEVEVDEIDGATLVPVREFVIGGAPAAIAVQADGQEAFVADTESEEIVRLSLTDGAVLERVPVAAEPGPITLSQDGTALLVGRPMLLDVLVFDNTSGTTLTQLDANPVLTPVPQCLDDCGSQNCTGTHPADAALCRTPSGSGEGLAQSPSPAYAGIYLESVPSRMAAMGGEGQGFTVTCASEGTTYTQVVAVAGVDGPIRFIGLRTATGDESAPESPLSPVLIARGACKAAPATIAPTAAETGLPVQPLDAYMTACPAHPDRARFDCLQAVTATVTEPNSEGQNVERPSAYSEAGVVIQKGAGAGGTWTLDWEGELIDARDSGGQISASGTEFVARGLDLTRRGLRPGDIVVINSPVKNDATCNPEGLTPAPQLERAITSLSFVDGDTLFTLAGDPLPTSCYVDPGNLPYTVRAGGVYLVQSPLGNVDRAAPGGSYGLASTTSGFKLPLMFTLKPTAEVDASLRQRGQPFAFKVTDEYGVVVAASDFGEVPGDMRLVSHPGLGPVLFVTYSGSPNSLVGFVPFNESAFNDESTYLVVQR